MSEEELYKKIKNGEIKNLRIDSKPIIEVEKMISTGNIELYTKDYVNDLQQRINKAIEYIEKSTIQIGVYGELDSFKKEPIYALKNDFKINNVLDILRGDFND